MTKRPVQKPAHGTTQKHVKAHDAKNIQKKTFGMYLVMKRMTTTFSKPLMYGLAKSRHIKHDSWLLTYFTFLIKYISRKPLYLLCVFICPCRKWYWVMKGKTCHNGIRIEHFLEKCKYHLSIAF